MRLMTWRAISISPYSVVVVRVEVPQHVVRAVRLQPGAGTRPLFDSNSVSEGSVPLISSKSRVCLPKDDDPVGLSLSRSVEPPKWTVLIGRTGFDTMYSIPDPTLIFT
jgi:hypothetical protein